MSQLITTHPDTIIAFLQTQGARCGASVQPQVLKDCPVENFCWLDGQELCVLGPNHDVCTASTASLAAPPAAAVALQPVGHARELTGPVAASGSSEASAITIVLLVVAGIALAARRRDHHVFSDHQR